MSTNVIGPVLLATLKNAEAGSDFTVLTTLEDGANDKLKFTSFFVNDYTGEYVGPAGDPSAKTIFYSTGGLDEALSVTANSVGTGGYVDSHGLFTIVKDLAGNVDLVSSKSSGGSAKIEKDNILSSSEWRHDNGIEIEMLHDTVSGKDGLIAYTAEYKGKIVVMFESIFVDDETGQFDGRWGDSKTDFRTFKAENIDNMIAFDALSVGENGFNVDHAFALLTEDTADQFDFYTIDQSGRVATLQGSDILRASFSNKNGDFDRVDGSTKMAFLSNTITGNDGLIVQLGEDDETGQGQWEFTRILTNDSTGAFAFFGDTKTPARYIDLNGDLQRPDVAAILALEAAPVGADGIDLDAAYLMTTMDEGGNYDLYSVSHSGVEITLLEDNFNIA